MTVLSEGKYSSRSFQLVGDENLAMKSLSEVRGPFTLNIRWATETILAIFAGSILIALLMWEKNSSTQNPYQSACLYTQFMKQHMSDNQ